MDKHHVDPELLSAYLDDEVSRHERTVVETHLKSCRVCQRELAGLRWTVELLHALPAPELPRPFYVRQADLAQDRATPPRGLSWVDWLQQLTGTFRVLSYASAISFVLVLLLTVAGIGPAQFGLPASAPLPEERMAEPQTLAVEEADRTTPPAEAATMEEEALRAAEAEVVEEPSEKDSRAEPTAVAEAARPAATAPVEGEALESAAAPPAPAEEAESEGAVSSATAPAVEAPAESPAVPRTTGQPPGGLDLNRWLLLLTGLSTIVFGGLARWLNRS